MRGWVAFISPIVLSIGAAFTALNLDLVPIPDMQSIKWPKWFNEKDKKEKSIEDLLKSKEHIWVASEEGMEEAEEKEEKKEHFWEEGMTEEERKE